MESSQALPKRKATGGEARRDQRVYHEAEPLNLLQVGNIPGSLAASDSTSPKASTDNLQVNCGSPGLDPGLPMSEPGLPRSKQEEWRSKSCCPPEPGSCMLITVARG